MKESFGLAGLALAGAAVTYGMNWVMGTQDGGACRLAIVGLLTMGALAGSIGLLGLVIRTLDRKKNQS
ncbi:hypothetical protein [Duganella vulcania]|uniref:Uncharacterized protein n=1 Tax=Duganella vulcania TaxID=2692166 RepID=A0A845GDF4_9BURK|nr:hypothetical protein [Duganella vulcania]MYM92653.1 hypothetical protein [Duganella vulcania]